MANSNRFVACVHTSFRKNAYTQICLSGLENISKLLEKKSVGIYITRNK